MQAELKCLFPTTQHIVHYAEVIKFAFGLSDQPSALTGVVFDNLLSLLKVNWGFSAGFLLSLAKELKEGCTFDVFHNKYFNYPSKGGPIVHIPSRFYRFDDDVPDFEAITIRLSKSSLIDALTAEYLVKVTTKVSLLNTLRILQYVQKHQQISVSSFRISDVSSKANDAENDEENAEISRLLIHSFKLSNETSSISIEDGHLTKEAYSHIVNQLHCCSQLQVLRLRYIGQELPLELGYSAAMMTALRMIDLAHCGLTQDVSKALMSGLQHCLNLCHVCLQGNQLSSCL